MSLRLDQFLVPMQSNGGGGAILLLVYLVVIVVVVAGLWKAFEKAGEPGWAAVIPIYNLYVMVKISGNPWWWMLLFLLPILNLIAALKISIDAAKAFGQGLGFGLGLTFLGFIFWPLLGFGSYEYEGVPE